MAHVWQFHRNVKKIWLDILAKLNAENNLKSNKWLIVTNKYRLYVGETECRVQRFIFGH